jgi:hypothetical protein
MQWIFAIAITTDISIVITYKFTQDKPRQTQK